VRSGAILSAVNAVQQGQRGALMPWSAVALGLGVAIYFGLPLEPGLVQYGVAGAIILLGIALGLWRRETLAPLGWALALCALGFAAAGLRAHQAAGPVLEFRYYGPVEGRVVGIDRSASDALRLTLDAVRLDDVAPERTPRRVRVSLHGDQRWLDPEPGTRVMMTAHLGPPAGPAEPGGFDFQRHAWFLSLGAVGYTRTPVLLAEARPEGTAAVFHLRMEMSQAIRDRIDGQPGAFAAAVLTGDRSGLNAETTENMRVANIAHLLAISGLHMGLLTGFVYGALRFVLALIPPLALRYPIRKWAAAGALGAGAFYLVLSGGNVATERAFIQVAVMLTAVMLDRRAITLRSVAIAAVILLLHRPETLFSPGFQMSFAATAALVAVFNGLRDVEWLRVRPAWQRWVFALVLSSLVAGLATAPFAAAHFNRIAHFGLVANLLTVPLMGSLIIPAAVVAALLAPLGLSWLAFAVMEPALAWTLEVAARVAAMPGAVSHVPSPPGATLALIAMAGLIAILWRGRGRWVALAPTVLATLLWSEVARPDLLVSDTGRLAGVLTEEGRSLSRARGDGFVAGVWLENDGDGALQEDAALRGGWRESGAGLSASLGGLDIWQGAGRRALSEAASACATHDLVILSEPARDADPPFQGARPDLGAPAHRLAQARAQSRTAEAPATCTLIDADVLAETGALAIDIKDGALRIRSARGAQGDRLWTR
jgi:competence protein ComEC